MIANNSNQQKAWTHTTLNEFCGQRGQSIEPSKTPDSKFELYSVPSFPARQPEIVSGKEVGSNKQIVTPECVLLCKINPRINRAWVVGQFSHHTKIASTEWIVFPPDKRVESRFLCYFLQQNAVRDFLASNVSGVGGSLMRVKPSTLRDFSFAYPERDEQSSIIAEIEKQFSRLDEAVANLNRVMANLKRYKASVLKAAVEGKLTEDWRKQHPDVEPASKLLERILAERRAKWSGKGKYKEPMAPDTISLPHLPEGWMWATCDQLCSQITDGEHIQPRYKPVGYPMLSAKNVRDGYVDFGNIDLISEVDFQNCLKRCSPKENDVLIVSVGATTGRTAIVSRCAPFSLVRSVLLLRPIQNPRFMLRWLQSPWIQTLIQRASGSTAQAHLYIRDTRTISIPLPSDHEQKEIIAEVDRRLSVIEELESAVEANLTRTDRLRQSILSQAFDGRLVN